MSRKWPQGPEDDAEDSYGSGSPPPNFLSRKSNCFSLTIMSKKEVIFGAKRQGVTFLYRFETRAMFNRAKAYAKLLGLSLGKLKLDGEPKWPEQRRFSDEDAESSTLKIQITKIDDFTQACMRRQAAHDGCQSIESYIVDAALKFLENNEEQTRLNPQTGEVALLDHELGRYIGCQVDKGAKNPPRPYLTRIPIPKGTVIEEES